MMALPLTLLVHILTFGVGEETGWRGFALPRLQSNHTAIQATHLLALGWGLWHLPTFFENPSFMEMGPVEILGWSAGLWMGAVFLTWLFNSSGGSLIVVVLWHGLFNQFAASEASPAVAAVITMGVILLAVAALRLAGPNELTGLSRDSGARQRHGHQARIAGGET
jgi:membrane protease YdiL (CAAX protease family)